MRGIDLSLLPQQTRVNLATVAFQRDPAHVVIRILAKSMIRFQVNFLSRKVKHYLKST